MKDRLSTRNILRRKNIQLESYNCVLCQSQSEDTVQHLFLSCPFAKECWSLLNIDFQVDSAFPKALLQTRVQSHSYFSILVAILMSWAIWTARNDLIFNNIQPSVNNVKVTFTKEIKLLIFGIKSSISDIFDLWIQNLL